MQHLDWRSVVDAAEPAGRGAATGFEHLRACPRCARRVRRVQALLDALEMAGAGRPTEALMDRTWARLRRLREAARPAGSAVPADNAGMEPAARLHPGELLKDGLRAIRATLIGDSWRPAPALRGTAEAAARALVFETNDYAISLLVTPEPGKVAFNLIGQVVPKTALTVPPSGKAALRSTKVPLEAPVSELGEFRFRGLPAGDLQIRLELGELRIECPSFAMTGRRSEPGSPDSGTPGS